MDETEKEIRAIISELRRIREEKRLSQLESSMCSGVSQTMISQVESGIKSPSLQLFLRLSTALGVMPEVIIQSALRDSNERVRDKKAVIEIIEKWI